MSPKVKEGFSYTHHGGDSHFLLHYKDLFDWHDLRHYDIKFDGIGGWSFIEGEDEYLIEGAALVAPLSILFWGDE